MYSGTSGYLAYFLFRILFPIFGLGLLFIKHEIDSIYTKNISSSYVALFFYLLVDFCWVVGWVRKAIATQMDADEFKLRKIDPFLILFSSEIKRSKISKNEGVKWLIWICDNILFKFGSLMAGVPIRQLNLGIHRSDNVQKIFERVFWNSDLVNDNYFFSGYLLGEYLPNNCPRYLMEENYEILRQSLNDRRLTLFHGSLCDAIQRSKHQFTVASFLGLV